MRVTVKKVNGRNGVLIEAPLLDEVFLSSEDLYRIVDAVCWCANEKYPNGEGIKMMKEFLNDCCDEVPFELLKKKYKIPSEENS